MNLTRQTWFDNYFLLAFKSRCPDMHMTLDIYGNKARISEGFDRRTADETLRKKAEDIYHAEIESINAYRTSEFNNTLQNVIDKLLDFIQTSGIVPRKVATVKKPPIATFNAVKQIIPELIEFEFKEWSKKVDKDDHPIVAKLKKQFKDAYNVFHSTKDGEPLKQWYIDYRAEYTK